MYEFPSPVCNKFLCVSPVCLFICLFTWISPVIIFRYHTVVNMFCFAFRCLATCLKFTCIFCVHCTMYVHVIGSSVVCTSAFLIRTTTVHEHIRQIILSVVCFRWVHWFIWYVIAVYTITDLFLWSLETKKHVNDFGSTVICWLQRRAKSVTSISETCDGFLCSVCWCCCLQLRV